MKRIFAAATALALTGCASQNSTTMGELPTMREAPHTESFQSPVISTRREVPTTSPAKQVDSAPVELTATMTASVAGMQQTFSGEVKRHRDNGRGTRVHLISGQNDEQQCRRSRGGRKSCPNFDGPFIGVFR